MASERLGEGGDAPAVVGGRMARRREPPAGAEDAGRVEEDKQCFCDGIRGNHMKR